MLLSVSLFLSVGNHSICYDKSKRRRHLRQCFLYVDQVHRSPIHRCVHRRDAAADLWGDSLAGVFPASPVCQVSIQCKDPVLCGRSRLYRHGDPLHSDWCYSNKYRYCTGSLVMMRLMSRDFNFCVKMWYLIEDQTIKS